MARATVLKKAVRVDASGSEARAAGLVASTIGSEQAHAAVLSSPTDVASSCHVLSSR